MIIDSFVWICFFRICPNNVSIRFGVIFHRKSHEVKIKETFGAFVWISAPFSIMFIFSWARKSN
jgi:hypothetical protein